MLTGLQLLIKRREKYNKIKKPNHLKILNNKMWQNFLIFQLKKDFSSRHKSSKNQSPFRSKIIDKIQEFIKFKKIHKKKKVLLLILCLQATYQNQFQLEKNLFHHLKNNKLKQLKNKIIKMVRIKNVKTLFIKDYRKNLLIQLKMKFWNQESL